MSTPKPAPPRKHPCRRYNADGTACPTLTPRLDGWCGTCDGFTSAEPALLPRPRTKPSTAPKRTWIPVHSVPLEAEDLTALQVSRVARDSFAARHRCGTREAEAQIRSMVEDLILDDETECSRSEDGDLWSMRHSGYTLLFSKTLDVLIGYSTRHRERTWTQVRAGVPSRVRAGKVRYRPGGPAWFYAMEADYRLSVRCSYAAASLYVHVAKDGKLKRLTASQYMPEMVRRIEAAVAEWDGSDGHFFLTDREDFQLSWLLVKEPGEPAVIVTVGYDAEQVAA